MDLELPKWINAIDEEKISSFEDSLKNSIRVREKSKRKTLDQLREKTIICLEIQEGLWPNCLNSYPHVSLMRKRIRNGGIKYGINYDNEIRNLIAGEIIKISPRKMKCEFETTNCQLYSINTKNYEEPVISDDVKGKIDKNQYKIVAIIHAETSTGVCNPVAEIGSFLKDMDTIYLNNDYILILFITDIDFR